MLQPDDEKSNTSEDAIDRYCRERCLPRALLDKLGAGVGSDGIEWSVPYGAESEPGKRWIAAYRRIRDRLMGDGSHVKWWTPPGTKSIVYGLHLLRANIWAYGRAAPRRGFLTICDGETDAFTLMSHCFPSVACPGGSTLRGADARLPPALRPPRHR